MKAYWWIGALLLALLLAGCGGGGTTFVDVDPFTAPTASAEFRYSWPAGINVLGIELYYQGKSVGQQTALRTAGESRAFVRFTRLYPNNLTFLARTYRTLGDTAVVKEGWGGVRVRPSQTPVVTLAQDEPIAELLILPAIPVLAVGQSLQLIAVLRNANKAILLDTPGSITWTTEDAAKVAVTATGAITAYQKGGNVTARHTTAMSDSTFVDVPGLPGGQGLITFSLNYDGFEELEGDLWSLDSELNADIYLMNSDGSNLNRMTTNFAVDEYPSLSPDGRVLAFSSNRGNSTSYTDDPIFDSDVYVMKTDGSGQYRAARYGIYPTFFANGTKLAFVRQDGIYQANLNGSGISRLVATRFARNGQYAISPDNTIYYTNRASDDTFEELYMLKSGSTTPVRLTEFSNDPLAFLYTVWHPACSPDGKTVAFAFGNPGTSAYIYLIDADGSNLRKLSMTAGGVERLSFSPDGTQLLVTLEYNRAREGYELMVMNLNDGAATLIAGPYTMSGSWGGR